MVSRKRKIEDENTEFRNEWPEHFALIQDSRGHPLCLICSEELASNKQSNLERPFQRKYSDFAENYPVGDAIKKYCQFCDVMR